MEEMRTINLDKYDYRLILNALNEFRNKIGRASCRERV